MADLPVSEGNSFIIKVMTFNIRYGTADDGEQSWTRRRRLVLERIRAFDPDLLGLQECRDDTQAAYLKARLEDYDFLGVQRGGLGDPALEMAPLLFKRSSFEPLDHGHLWLSDTPDLAESTSWGSIFPRTVTWVTLRRKQPDPTHYHVQVLTFLNTHFDYGGEATIQSAILLRRHIDRLPVAMPVILTGDFNAEKDTPPYHTLLTGIAPASRPLYDTYRESHAERSECEGTYHDYGRRAVPASIDWLLASDHFLIMETRVDRTCRGNLYPSDHYPLLAKVRLPSWPA